MDEEHEYALLQGLLCMEKHALEEIFERYSEKLFRQAYAFTLDSDESRDIAIIVLQRLFESPKEFMSIKQLDTYLNLSCRSRSIDALRKRKRINVTKIQYSKSSVIDYDRINEQLDEEFADRLHELVAALPQRARRVVQLFYLEGMKQKDIARAMDISPRTVENLLGQALRNLRKSFKGRGFDFKVASFVLLVSKIITSLRQL